VCLVASFTFREFGRGETNMFSRIGYVEGISLFVHREMLQQAYHFTVDPKDSTTPSP
jgi:hypothetical protein